MESLQQLLQRVTKQLQELTLSQRLAVLLGGALVGISLLWLLQWAASPEMVPLLDQDFSAEELARVERGLQLTNTPYKLVDSRIMVRADQNPHVILAQLQQEDRLPADTSTGFAALVKESNPWISQAEHERRWTVAVKTELEKVLSQYSGVRSASVFLPMGSSQRRFARVEPAQSASVTLIMEGGQPVARELALTVAKMVAGAVQGLDLKNVEVLDGSGVTALDWATESAGFTALDRQRRKLEQETRAKILRQLADPSARVGVQVELEMTDQQLERETPGETVVVSEEMTSEETQRARPSGQPGVQPNVGLAAGGRVAEERTSRETSKIESVPGVTRERITTPPGAVRQIWAAVNISHSYLTAIYRRKNPEADPPGEAEIQAEFERERARIIRQVAKLVKPQEEENVAVDWYYDTQAEAAAALAPTRMDETMMLVRQFGPQSGLALLALLSLLMMVRLAKKTDAGNAFGMEIGLPQEAIDAARQAAQDVAAAAKRRSGAEKPSDELSGAVEQPIGSASTTEGVLVAREVDEKTVQVNKMLDQVAEVVETDPEAASALLEQWIQRNDSYEQ